MNDLLNDIRTLEKIQSSFRTVLSTRLNSDKKTNAIKDVYFLLNQMKTEKQVMVNKFEQEAPKDIQDLCNMIRGGK